MDLDQAIRALLEEKKRLDHLIAVLEELERGSNHIQTPARKRRGRKSMRPEERRQVSERMKRYWAQRKQQAQAAAEGGDAGAGPLQSASGAG